MRSFCVSDVDHNNCLSHTRAAGSPVANHVCARTPGLRFWLVGGEVRHVTSPHELPTPQPGAVEQQSATQSSSAHDHSTLASTTCTLSGWSPSWGSRNESSRLKHSGRVTLYPTLTAAITPDGTVTCGVDADGALDLHAPFQALPQRTPTSNTASQAPVATHSSTHVSSDGAGGFSSGTPGGLLFIHAYRQV